MKVEQIDAEFAFKEILNEIIDSKFDMSINWELKFKEKLNYFDKQRILINNVFTMFKL